VDVGVGLRGAVVGLRALFRSGVGLLVGVDAGAGAGLAEGVAGRGDPTTTTPPFGWMRRKAG
jgi:hypothetical protein